MFHIVKNAVIPSFHICFDEVVFHAIKSGVLQKSKYPLWEVYLNVLIQEFEISNDSVAETVKIAVNLYNTAEKEILKFINFQ